MHVKEKIDFVVFRGEMCAGLGLGKGACAGRFGDRDRY
jgi:hypothetical protein